MKKNEKVLKKLRPLNRMDERELYCYDNVESLPNGDYGMCVITVKGKNLIISDADMSNIGGILYTVPMDQIENLRHRRFLGFHTYVKFDCQGMPFHLKYVSKEILAEMDKYAKKA